MYSSAVNNLKTWKHKIRGRSIISLYRSLTYSCDWLLQRIVGWTYSIQILRSISTLYCGKPLKVVWDLSGTTPIQIRSTKRQTYQATLFKQSNFSIDSTWKLVSDINSTSFFIKFRMDQSNGVAMNKLKCSHETSPIFYRFLITTKYVYLFLPPPHNIHNQIWYKTIIHTFE
jgi:hypothetical protein